MFKWIADQLPHNEKFINQNLGTLQNITSK